MAITLRNFTDLDSAQVTQNLDEIAQRVQEDNPKLDMRFGVLHNIIAYYNSLLTTQRQANIDDYLHGRSLLDINADPSLADTDLVDADRKSTRLNSSHIPLSRMPSSA